MQQRVDHTDRFKSANNLLTLSVVLCGFKCICIVLYSADLILNPYITKGNLLSVNQVSFEFGGSNPPLSNLAGRTQNLYNK